MHVARCVHLWSTKSLRWDGCPIARRRRPAVTVLFTLIVLGAVIAGAMCATSLYERFVVGPQQRIPVYVPSDYRRRRKRR